MAKDFVLVGSSWINPDMVIEIRPAAVGNGSYLYTRGLGENAVIPVSPPPEEVAALLGESRNRQKRAGVPSCPTCGRPLV